MLKISQILSTQTLWPQPSLEPHPLNEEHHSKGLNLQQFVSITSQNISDCVTKVINANLFLKYARGEFLKMFWDKFKSLFLVFEPFSLPGSIRSISEDVNKESL